MIDFIYRTLASIGFDEPLHSPITHMPIGLVVGALVFFLVAMVFKRKSLVLSARHVSILALVFAFPTILLGVFDWIHFYHAVLMPAIRIKIALAGAVLVLLSLGIILGKDIKLRNIWMTLIYALSFVAVMGLGYFGAGIIYGRGLAAPAPASAPASPGKAGVAVAAGGDALGGDTSAGRGLFAANCQACHGNGGNAIDPSLPLKSSKRLASYEAFAAFVRAPSLPDGSAGQMPAFGPADLSDAELKDLLAYVNSAWQ